jgi:hypothetical protein
MNADHPRREVNALAEGGGVIVAQARRDQEKEAITVLTLRRRAIPKRIPDHRQ